MRRARLAVCIALLLPASSALAFDCKKASTRNEKAICADPAALAADARMSEAFAALLASAEPAQRPQIIAAQARWLSSRDSNCAESKGPALGACLALESGRRRAFLAGEPEAGPGAPGRIAPWFRVEKGGKGRAAVDLEALKFVEPASAAGRAFNAAVAKLTAEIEQPGKDDPADERYEYDWSMRLTYASPRLVSAQMGEFSDTGGAHPNTFTSGINIDVAAGREAQFDELVDAKGADKLFAFCNAAVIAQKKEKLGDDAPKSDDELKSLAHDVAEATRDLKAWSFGADKATVNYDAYAVGAYVEGPYDCEIPYATLRPLAKPGFPLP